MTLLRRWGVPVLVGLVVAAGAFALAAVLASPGDEGVERGSDVAARPSGAEPTRAEPSDESDPRVGYSLKGLLPPGYTRLGDCPEALAFFQRADVKERLTSLHGRTFDADDAFEGGCPSADTLGRYVGAPAVVDAGSR